MTGAALTLAGIALVGVLRPGGMWSGYSLKWRVGALLGVLILVDAARRRLGRSVSSLPPNLHCRRASPLLIGDNYLTASEEYTGSLVRGWH